MAAAGQHIFAEGQRQVSARGNAAAIVLRRTAGEYRRSAVDRQAGAVRRRGRRVIRRSDRDGDVATGYMVKGTGGDSVLSGKFTVTCDGIAVGAVIVSRRRGAAAKLAEIHGNAGHGAGIGVAAGRVVPHGGDGVADLVGHAVCATWRRGDGDVGIGHCR